MENHYSKGELDMEILDYSEQVNAIQGHRDAVVIEDRTNEEWITFHFSDVVHQPADRETELKRLLGEVRYHKTVNWGSAKRPIYGNHYMYDYVVLSDGLVVKTFDKPRKLWHCGNITGNNKSWSVHVMLGKNQTMTKAQKKSLFELFDMLCRESNIPKNRVVGHCEWPDGTDAPAAVSNTFRVQPGQSSCPERVLFDALVEYRNSKAQEPWKMRVKKNIDFAAVRVGRGINHAMATIDGKEVKLDPGSVIIVRDIVDGWAHLDSEIGFVSAVLLEPCNTNDTSEQHEITEAPNEDMSILETPNYDIDLITTKIASLSGQTYTRDEIYDIVTMYKKYADAMDINWIIALAQNLHETDWLRSWWAQSPRRNPAGLGVNGKHMKQKPDNTESWAEKDGVWYHGYSFDSWENAVKAHIAHLLLYTMKDSDMSDEQLKFSELSPRKYAVEQAGYRGIAGSIKDLAGTWATDTKYAKKLVATINKLIK